jgi:hypothetical protein
MTTLIPKFDLKDGGSTPAGAINRTIYEKLADTVSVKDFGAIGDGATNDTAALQAALNSIASGGSLYFPFGTYNHTGLSLTGSNINLYGDGAKLVYSGVSDGFLIQSANNANASNFYMSGLTFKNGVSAFKIKGQGTGIYSNINITSCIFDTSTSGMVWFEHCSDTVFDSNKLYDGGDNGVYYSFSNNAIISDNLLVNCIGSGAITVGYSDAVISANNIIIANNEIYTDGDALAGNYISGIDAVHCSDVFITGNHVSNKTTGVAGRQYKTGILVEENTIINVGVVANKIFNMPEYGIRLGTASGSILSNVKIASNEIDDCTLGIDANATQNLKISFNIISFCGQEAVKIKNSCSGVSVDHNTIIDAAQQPTFAAYPAVRVSAMETIVVANTFIDGEAGGIINSSVASPTYSVDGNGVIRLYSSSVLQATITTLGKFWGEVKTEIEAVTGWSLNLNIGCNFTKVKSIRRTGRRDIDDVNQYSIQNFLVSPEPFRYVWIDSATAFRCTVLQNTYKTNSLDFPLHHGNNDLFTYIADTLYDSNPDGGGRLLRNTASPTNGNYKVGDIIFNSAPVSGGYVGWVCVAYAPTPYGTWKTFGLIS